MEGSDVKSCPQEACTVDHDPPRPAPQHARRCLERHLTNRALYYNSKVSYSKPQPYGMIADLVIHGVLQVALDPQAGDPREWIPLSDTVSLRPVHFNVSQGCYAHMMRVTKGGVLSRHRHGGGVHALVLKGRWH